MQKLRRLEEINAQIQQLQTQRELGQPVDLALFRAMAEEKRLRSWIALHEHRR